MRDRTITMAVFKRDLPEFRRWLEARGAFLDDNREWNVLRYYTRNRLSIVYHNKKDQLSFTGQSMTDYTIWRAEKEVKG